MELFRARDVTVKTGLMRSSVVARGMNGCCSRFATGFSVGGGHRSAVIAGRGLVVIRTVVRFEFSRLVVFSVAGKCG